MTNKELRSLAKKIASLEKRMKKSGLKERAKIENEIAELASQLTLDEMIFVDECIRENFSI